MVNLTPKRRMAAEVLGVGKNRIRFDTSAVDALEDAITRGGIRSLIKDGIIWVVPKKGISRGRIRISKSSHTKRGKTPGKKEGKKFARRTKKEGWMIKVRSQRSRLKIMKDRGEINNVLFWKIYGKIGGGQVRSIKHMNGLIESYSKR